MNSLPLTLDSYQTATHLLYAVGIPYFFALIAIELATLRKLNGRMTNISGPIKVVQGYQWKDSVCSISMGAIMLVVTGVALLWTLPLMDWLYARRVFDLDVSAWWFVPLLIVADDFVYYWYHRTAHRCALFWAEHSNHHTSETYNLSTALRQSVTGPLYAFVFWLPLVWLGFHPLVLAFAHAVNLLYQYWIHTELFEVHGWFERVFNCPQHHRLHHAKNEEYHDCNYGGMFIVFDRWFGTYRDYTPGVAPVYGTLTPVLTTNPFKQAVMGWVHLAQKIRRTSGLKQRLLCLIKPPGWTPNKA